MRRTVSTVAHVTLVGLLAWMLVGRPFIRDPPEPGVDISSAPTIEQIRPLASLITTRVVVADALTASIAGHTGDLRVAVVVRGDAMIMIDLDRGRMEAIDHEARTATVVLPQPHAVNPRVDHEHTRIFSIDATGLWSLLPTDVGRAELIDLAMQQAQRAVMAAANEQSVKEQARARAQRLICAFFADSLHWTVDVRWDPRKGEVLP